MVDQPLSPPKKPRVQGKLSLPDTQPGMNKLAPNNRAIEGKGPEVKPKPNLEKDQKILERARSRINRAIAESSDNRKAMVDDLKFFNGNQWPADIATQRNTDKRPCLTINRMKTFVHQVVNAGRENRPSIMVSPVGDRSDKDGAKLFRGLIRRIERESHADIAYDTGLQQAVSCGLGWLRLRTEWSSEESFDQTLMIERVRNPLTVYLDPLSQQPDGSDAMWGFVTEIYSEDEFKLEFPDAQIVPYDLGGVGEKYKSWVVKDGIRIAEYYEIVKEPRQLVSLSTGYVGWEDDLDDLTQARIKRNPDMILDKRESFERKVKCYKLTCLEILERYDWIGKWVPLIPVIGDEIDIEGKVTLSGIVRDAKDAQRMYNYWETFKTELVALAPKASWLIAEGQDEGWEQEWKNANTRSRPALHYKPIDLNGNLAPPPQRIAPPPIPEGAVEAAQAAAQNMMATTGIRFDSTLAERTYDESGRALRELQRKGDVGAFHYYDNLRRSMEFAGRQMVDLIPKLYTRKQVTTILREDDSEEKVTLDPTLGKAYDEKQGPKGLERYFNPSFGEYGVTVDIGPSYATKRIESAESMMEFVKAMPQTAGLVMDLIAAEMDWPGAEKIAARLAKAIPAQLLTADLKDIPPQIQALIQNLEQQSKMLQAQLQAAMKELSDKQADRQVALQKIESDFEAKLLGILAKTEETTRKVAVEEFRATADVLLEGLKLQHTKEQAAKEPAKPEKQPNA